MVRGVGAVGEVAIASVRAGAQQHTDRHRRRIERVLGAQTVSVDVQSLCASIVERAQITLHFHPDRLTADGRTVAEGLRDEGVYRSQFETGISSGGLTAYPGGDRDEWERRLFDGAYHSGVQATARPKYGALNVAGFENGPAPAFGSCALVLGRQAAVHTTFLFGDSSGHGEDRGTADAFSPVLAALLERVAETGQMVGLPVISMADAVDRLTGAVAQPLPFSRELDEYIETQTHGEIDLAAGADALLLDPSYRDTPTGAVLLAAADRHRLAVRWHAGSMLTEASFPTTTPVGADGQRNRWQEFLLSGRAARLTTRIISGHGVLTAAAIGVAAADFTRTPGRWREWGAPDPSLTVMKDLWRILAVHGSHSRPGDS